MRDKKYADDPNGAYKDSGPIVYSRRRSQGRATRRYDQSDNPKIDFQTKDAKKFGELTQTNMGKLLGIFLDKKFVSAATIQGVITSDGQITGTFTEEDASASPTSSTPARCPSPSRSSKTIRSARSSGKIDLEKSLYASMVGLGPRADLHAGRLPFAGLPRRRRAGRLRSRAARAAGGVHAVLTLPGIAGFVLSIGMAVDANVLIFERLKEELWAGKTLRAAVQVGFKRAFTSVFDSHVTTIVGAGVLFLLGTGTVKGFAYTLFWGTAFSLFTAVFVTRFFMDVVVDNDLVENPKAYGA